MVDNTNVEFTLNMIEHYAFDLQTQFDLLRNAVTNDEVDLTTLPEGQQYGVRRALDLYTQHEDLFKVIHWQSDYMRSMAPRTIKK
jgi:hypothetical protein